MNTRDFSSWLAELLNEEHRLYRASALAEGGEYHVVRRAFEQKYLAKPALFPRYLPHAPPKARTHPKLRAYAEAAKPRTPSILRSFESGAPGEVVHLVMLGTHDQRVPGVLIWLHCLVARSVGQEHALVGLRGPCLQCGYSGVIQNCICPYCNGTRWSHTTGEDFDLKRVGRFISVT